MLPPHLWPAEVLAPQAHALDTQPEALQRALDAAAEAGLLGLRASPAQGGRGLSPLDFARVQVELARASGTFAFLQVQHQGALGFVSRAEDGAAWSACTEALARGHLRAGIAYGWLRRPGPPLVTATPIRGGHRLVGRLPWMTGWGFFSHCVVAARRPDGAVLLAWVDLSAEGVQASAPMRLAAFEAARTVAVDLELELPSEAILSVHPPDWLSRRDPSRAAPQAVFVLGLAWAALDLLQATIAEEPALPLLRAQVEQVDAAVFETIASGADGHAVRAEAIALAGRLSLAAIAACSGRSAQHDHAAQRIHRDLLGFTVLSQTPAVRRATLDRLAQGTVFQRALPGAS